jgi:uncharacterized protein involved in exopolysaccharide biosynthesis
MSLTQFLAILLARRWMVIAAMLASLAGAAVVLAVVPPRYTANTRLLLDFIKPDPVTGQVIGGQFARAYTATQTQLIKDYRVAGAVVDELGWSSDPTMLARYAVPGDPNGARHRLAQLIIDHTDARLIEGSNIMEISYTGWSPDASRTIADAIRKAYMNAAIQTKRESAAESADWYQAQVETSRRLLTMAEDTKARFEREHGLVMEDDKTDVDTARLAALSSSGVSTVSAPVVPVAGPSAAATELATVDAQLAQASRTLGANNPILVQLRQKHSVLTAQVDQERAAANAAAAAARSAASASSSASTALQTQKAKVLANRENLAKLRQLQNEVDVRRDQFTKASEAAAQLRAQAATDDAGVTVLSNAVAPDSPSFPNIPLVILGALGLGFALGLLAALLTELLNRRIRTARDLQDLIDGVPLLGVVGSGGRSQDATSWWKRILLPRGRHEEALAA